MKRCVIHFGMFKTGSSSIQESFWRQLDNAKWKYLNTDVPNHGGVLSTIMQANPPARHVLRGKFDEETFARRKRNLKDLLIKELGSDVENLLISAEWLSSDAYRFSELLAFRDLVASHVDTITVVGYIRPPKGYMESSFQEKLKHANPRKLNFEEYYPNYRARIEKFDKAFGPENVLLWRFDPATFPNGCVVQDFCARLGIDFPIASIKRINESLSREAIAFLYTYLQYGPNIPADQRIDRENGLLTERLATLRGSKMRFSWQSVLPVLKDNRTDIGWTEKRMGESLKLAHEKEAKGVNTIRSEADLLIYRPDDLRWLAEQLGADYEKRWHPKMTPQEVADWIHALRTKLASEDGRHRHASRHTTDEQADDDSIPQAPKGKRLTITALIRNAKQAAPELESIEDNKAGTLLGEAFRQLVEYINSTDEGVLKIDGFGKILIRQINQTINGKQRATKRTLLSIMKKQEPTDPPDSNN